MAEPSLAGVWAKIAQAKAHRDVLEKHTLRTVGPKTPHPRVGFKFDPDTRETILYVSRMRDFSSQLETAALVAGDVFHNLRSALDHLVYQLAVKAAKGDPKRPDALQFPICDHRTGSGRKRGFREQAERQLGEIEPRYRARIEALQPYPSRKRDPNAALAVLRDFSNHDKHRLLLPSIVMIKGFSLGLNELTFDMINSMSSRTRVARRGSFPLVAFRWPEVPIELSAELYRFTARPQRQGIEVKMVGQLTPAISLGKERTAVALCDRLIMQVTKTIGLFEDAVE